MVLLHVWQLPTVLYAEAALPAPDVPALAAAERARLDEVGRAAWTEAFLAGHFVPSKRGRRIRTEGERVTRQQQDEAARAG